MPGRQRRRLRKGRKNSLWPQRSPPPRVLVSTRQGQDNPRRGRHCRCGLAQNGPATSPQSQHPRSLCHRLRSPPDGGNQAAQVSWRPHGDSNPGSQMSSATSASLGVMPEQSCGASPHASSAGSDGARNPFPTVTRCSGAPPVRRWPAVVRNGGLLPPPFQVSSRTLGKAPLRSPRLPPSHRSLENTPRYVRLIHKP